MRRILLGAGAGLVVGALGAWAISHFYYEDKLAQLAAELASARASQDQVSGQVDKVKKDLSDQVAQLTMRNAELKKLSATPGASTNAAPAAAMPPINPMALAGMFRGMGPTQQRLLLLKSRLKLTPEQEVEVKAMMEDYDKARRDVFRKMYQGGKLDPTAAASLPSLEASLAQILTPDQMTTYKKVQQEEKTSQAETMATMQLGQVTPLLQLSDTQKDQMYNTLYQSQMSMPDATSLMGNPNAPALVAEQAKATDAALAKILTPAQLELYHEQIKSMPRFGGPGGGRGNRGGGQPGGAPGGQTGAAR